MMGAMGVTDMADAVEAVDVLGVDATLLSDRPGKC